MNFTKWFKLKKPEQEEFYDVDDFNFNADILDTELKNVKDNYLPLAGGTVTGDVAINGALTVPNGLIRTNDTSKVMTIICTADDKSGAKLLLGGKDATNNAGEFVITSTNGTNSFNFWGLPTGKLTWGNKNIVRSVNGVTADDNGNIILEVGGTVKSVNGVTADDNGNINLTSIAHAVKADSATNDRNNRNIVTTYALKSNYPDRIKLGWDTIIKGYVNITIDTTTWGLITSDNIRSQSVAYANTAGSSTTANYASRSTDDGSFFINGYEVSVG